METDKVPNTIAIPNIGKVGKYHFNSLFGFARFILKDSKFFVFILDSDTFFSVIKRVNKSKHQMVIITSLSNLEIYFLQGKNLKGNWFGLSQMKCMPLKQYILHHQMDSSMIWMTT